MHAELTRGGPDACGEARVGGRAMKRCKAADRCLGPGGAHFRAWPVRLGQAGGSSW